MTKKWEHSPWKIGLSVPFSWDDLKTDGDYSGHSDLILFYVTKKIVIRAAELGALACYISC